MTTKYHKSIKLSQVTTLSTRVNPVRDRGRVTENTFYKISELAIKIIGCELLSPRPISNGINF